MNHDTWKEAKGKEKKRAFSVVQYNTKFGKKSGENDIDFEYFIIMNGMRPENYSKGGNRTGWGINNFLPALEKSDKRFKVASILLDNDAPLEKQAELVAKYINQIKENEACKKIHILGVSKCGTMSVALLKYLENSNLDKLNIMSYSAPYLGTIFASPLSLYRKVDEVAGKVQTGLIEKIIPYLEKIKPITKKEKKETVGLTNILKKIHWNVFSQSHMDYDIAQVDGKGVPMQHKNRYDASYLNEMFDSKTIDMLRKVRFTNIATYCTKQTLRNAIATHNINEAMLYLSSKIIFDKEKADGMVPLKSAKYIEEVCKLNSISIDSMEIEDGHHDIGSDLKIIEEIVNEKILEKDKEYDFGSR